jgi:hypothetical protein
MKRVSASNRRGGVLALALTGVGLLSVGTVAVVSFKSTGSGSANTASKAPRALQPGEVATVLRLIGITPDAVAASGLTSIECESMFSVASGYCLQAERLTQLQLALRDVNLANNRAVHPSDPGPVNSQGQEITVAQAQTALDNLREAGFSFVTSGLDSRVVAKLAQIRINTHWGIDAPYLVVARPDPEWLALRGALAAKRHAAKLGLELDAKYVASVAAADANATVAQASLDFANHFAEIRQTWRNHETSAP